ncbi:hypothetical protein PCANC_16031 [Puccinia coronata f. sp. avenae]|uniref:Uncharacterized protein n=1 Tax=Puccinia coronata f. sp. avenae TaxID=200324 RepID=A0A2N5ULP7_9BASI|nr:hypothetical protein PCANC_16031 [Puccinia coronata f. sp. avenae]
MDGRASSFQREQRPFAIPIFSQSFAINILLTSLQIYFCIIHHSLYFLHTVPSAVEALITLWEYAMNLFPESHDQRVLDDLTDMLGWFFQESPGPAQLLATIPEEEPNYLAGYIKSRSPVSLDKICASIINQSKKLFTQSGYSD